MPIMCGISGIISLTGKPVASAGQRISHMNKLLQHRGPDSEGVYVSPDGLVALGNTRLAIVDVRNNFSVPMVSSDNRSVLAYNGEIFNFCDERERLSKKYNISFRTHSDTEVMLHGLYFEGEDYLKKLDGFFGFGFYNAQTKEFILGRDLLGERHVFYYIDENELVFSSEVKPILSVIDAHLEIDFQSVISSFQYRAAPPRKTLLKGVDRLEAGFCLTLRAGKPTIAFKRTLRLHPEKWFDFFASNPSENQLLDVFQEAFSNSCMSRIPDEVGFMSTLSGGIDSTLVNVFASQYGKRTIDSLYGISSESHPKKGSDINELEASRITSKKLNTNHHVFSMIDDNAIGIYKAHAEDSFDGDFDEVAPMYNQLADQAVLRKDKVLLISDGPDELLGGYVKDFSAYNLFNRYKNKPVRSLLMRQFFQNPQVHRFLFQKNQVDQINWSFIKDTPFRFRPAHGGTTIRVLDRLFDFKNVLATESSYGMIPQDYADLLPHLDFSQRMALSYSAYSLPDHYNLRTDRGAMRSSVEVRMPWQSPRMVELMIATPERWRFCKGHWSKYLFRRLVERHVGKEIAFRNKYGFGYPLWRIPRYAEKMKMRSAISESSVFRDLPFKSGAKKFLLSPKQIRNHWIAYSLALTYEQLKNKKSFFWK